MIIHDLTLGFELLHGGFGVILGKSRVVLEKQDIPIFVSHGVAVLFNPSGSGLKRKLFSQDEPNVAKCTRG